MNEGWTRIVLGIIALVIFLVALPWLLRPFFRLLLLPRYGFRVWGSDRLPRTGPVVVIANHCTWLDGLFLGAVFPRRAKALVNQGMLGGPLFRWYMVWLGVIPVPFSGPKAQRAAIQASREAIDRGDVFVIFPEGQLTRNGFVCPFYRGLELIMRGKEDVPVVPIYLDNLWGSIWGFSGGRWFWKPVQGLRRVIGVSFGEPIVGKVDLFRLRQGLLEASVVPVGWRKGEPDELETIDLKLPHFLHHQYGLLTASTPNYEHEGVRQEGTREGTLGQALPGVVIRAVDELGRELSADAIGRLQAKIAGQADHWVGLGHRGSVDKDGFVRVV